MSSRRARPRRFLLPTILAMVLAAEITGIALARTLTPATSPVAAAAPAAVAPATGSTAMAGRATGSAADDVLGRARHALPSAGRSTMVGDQLATSAPTRPAEPVRAAVATAKPQSRGSSGSGPRYHGTDHVWIPSLGITKAVQSFPCSRSRPPDAGVYRWGCAGRNNVYLLGHAWSTFKPLHDAYVGARLHTGMKVIYADGGGAVHTYSVIWWKVVKPTTAASWAWASLSRPSMTLQTCVGANSAYRLMVRLVRVG
jgi:hypothetical protein